MRKGDIIPHEVIENKILFIRDKKVMIDRDIALLYGVQTKVLNQAVRRNLNRFPEDFMFQLTKEETEGLLRSQFVTLERGRHYKYLPYAFTENGVPMLSSVLNSDRAIEVNIEIMRAFTRLREMIISHKDLQRKIDNMERKYDAQFKIVFDAIKQLLEPPARPKKRIGFLADEKGK
ncbi:MAG TPA: ORF6N domain-containing protein [Thermodesulfovibrionales bacterium]|nr:ORF6N domain-containing protein [Thermodesulfovibrionales bacterium]